jgi:hypothetical protein
MSDNNSLFSFALFGSRYGQTFPSLSKLRQHYRSAEITDFEGTEVAKLKDPYTQTDKYRFEDCFCKDAIARRCITSYAYFLMGRRMTTTIDVNSEFMNPMMQQQVLSQALNEGEVGELKTLIDKTNAQVKFHARVEAAVVQAFVGGRSALKVERAQGGMPTDLKVLTWSKLGQVFADKESWQFLGVEYQDRDDPLLAEELIYFSNMDYNVSPDSLYYGRSMLEPVVDMVETNQYLHQEDLKEAARTLWASSGLVKFPPNISEEKARDFVRGLMPGVWNSTSQQVEMEQLTLDVKLKDLIEVSRALDKRTATGIGTPAILAGFEDIMNRATSEMLLNAWRESDLNRYRTWLQDTLESQWFNSLIQLRFPDLDLSQMWLKAKLEFEDVNFETLRDRAESLLPAVQSGYLSVEKFLEVCDFPDEVEKRAAAMKVKAVQRQQDLEMMRMRDQQQQQIPPPRVAQPPQLQQQQDQNAALEQTAKELKATLADTISKLQTERSSEDQSRQTETIASLQRLEARLNQIQAYERDSKQETQVQTLQASIQQTQLDYAREEHQKRMELLEQKADVMAALKAKIADFES